MNLKKKSFICSPLRADWYGYCQESFCMTGAPDSCSTTYTVLLDRLVGLCGKCSSGELTAVTANGCLLHKQNNYWEVNLNRYPWHLRLLWISRRTCLTVECTVVGYIPQPWTYLRSVWFGACWTGLQHHFEKSCVKMLPIQTDQQSLMSVRST